MGEADAGRAAGRARELCAYQETRSRTENREMAAIPAIAGRAEEETGCRKGVEKTGGIAPSRIAGHDQDRAANQIHTETDDGNTGCAANRRSAAGTAVGAA